jgi:hypothetical protein
MASGLLLRLQLWAWTRLDRLKLQRAHRAERATVQHPSLLVETGYSNTVVRPLVRCQGFKFKLTPVHRIAISPRIDTILYVPTAIVCWSVVIHITLQGSSQIGVTSYININKSS